MHIPHPWRRLHELVHVTLAWHEDEPGAPMGRTRHSTATISLRKGMTQAQRRCTLAHELLHIERGPTITTLDGREELRVRREAARFMLPDIQALGDALAWAHTLDEAADELWVDTGTLRDRLVHLHPAERHYLQRRLDEPDGEEVP